MHKILVVDDEVEVVRALHRVLRRDFAVERAHSGEEALSKLSSFQPDVVIYDFRMPGMNGAELLARVKERLPLCTRLILSGYADLESVLASVNEGEVCRFLKKPWSNDDLLSTIHNMLANHQLLSVLSSPFAKCPPGVIVESVQEESRLLVNARVTGKPFDADSAAALVARIAGVLEQETRTLIGGLLERHAGKLSFTAEIGGDLRLTLELPLRAESEIGEVSS